MKLQQTGTHHHILCLQGEEIREWKRVRERRAKALKVEEMRIAKSEHQVPAVFSYASLFWILFSIHLVPKKSSL